MLSVPGSMPVGAKVTVGRTLTLPRLRSFVFFAPFDLTASVTSPGSVASAVVFFRPVPRG